MIYDNFKWFYLLKVTQVMFATSFLKYAVMCCFNLCHFQLGEYNQNCEVNKEMIVTSFWWKKPEKLNIFLNEYQVYSIKAGNIPVTKRRLLCQTNYHFFQDETQDYLQKCLVIIKDNTGSTCFKKTYWQIDRKNRKFYTNQ